MLGFTCGLRRPPCKDATADYQRDHGGNKKYKVHLVHHGALRRLKHRAVIAAQGTPRFNPFVISCGNLAGIRRNSSRLILRQQLRRRSLIRIIRIINVRNLLPVSVPHDVVVRLEFGGPRRREIAGRGRACVSLVYNLQYPMNICSNSESVAFASA